MAASAAEAKLGAIFHNAQLIPLIQRILEALGHPQPPTPLYCDNSTAVSIIQQTIKQKRSRAMNMRYFWTIDLQNGQVIKIQWLPGADMIADYVTKHHTCVPNMKITIYSAFSNLKFSMKPLGKNDPESSLGQQRETIALKYHF